MDACPCRVERLGRSILVSRTPRKKSNLKKRPEKPILRTRSRMAARRRHAPTNNPAPRQKLRLKKQLEKPIPLRPKPEAARKPHPKKINLPAKPETKLTIYCFPRRRSLAGAPQIARRPRTQANLKKQSPPPRQTVLQIARMPRTQANLKKQSTPRLDLRYRSGRTSGPGCARDRHRKRRGSRELG